MKKFVLALCLILAGLMLHGCVAGEGVSLTGYRYDSPANASIGGGSAGTRVENININWIEGNVEIAWHDGSDVRVVETAGRSLKRDEELRWWVEGDTLQVKYAASGFHSTRNLDKRLTVLLPREMKLGMVEISTVSANVQTAELKVDQLKLDTVSGNMTAAAAADEVHIGTVSGDVTFMADQVRNVNANAVSGDMHLSFRNAPAEIHADAVSGSVTIRLPEGTGINAQVETVSGRVDGTMPTTKQGKNYTSGDGRCRIMVDTVSGNVHLDHLP